MSVVMFLHFKICFGRNSFFHVYCFSKDKIVMTMNVISEMAGIYFFKRI